jgi:hypothetical protein
MATWKKRNGHPPDAKVFICSGGYFDFRDALLARGWVENFDKDSPFFDLQWGMASHINHDDLQSHQIVNHFKRAREITTKVGLTVNLRNSRWHNGVDVDSFYPRAFDLYDPLDRAEFVLDFKLTHVESILRRFIEQLDGGAAVTFSREVVEMSLDILKRCTQDLDDIIDDSALATTAFDVTKKEWALLQCVNLDDASKRLEPSTNAKTLEAVISKQTSKRLSNPRETKTKEKDLVVPKKAKKKKKKTGDKADSRKPSEVSVSAEVSDFLNGQGTLLAEQVKAILKKMEETNPQSAINGTRNAWIIKPAGKSRGRGIQMLRDLDEIFKATECDEFQWVCQKYIEQPQIPFGYKFDIRQWALVTDWNPLTVYVWQQPYIRFAGEKYDASLEDKNQYMHLVNNSIVKYMDGFHSVNDELGTAGCMWFRQQYEGWLHTKYCKRKECEHCVPFLIPPPYTCETFGVKQEECFYVAKSESDDEDAEGGADAGSGVADAPRRKNRYEPPEPNPLQARQSGKRARAVAPSAPEGSEPCENLWESCVFPQIKDIILWSLRTVMENVDSRRNSVELFGYDFMLSEGEKPRVWLIEVNSSPAMDYSTHVTTPLVKKVMEDTVKLLVDRREDPSADIGEWELLRHDAERQVVHRPPFTGKLEMVGTAMRRPRCRTKKKKKKAKKQSKSELECTSAQKGTPDEEQVTPQGSAEAQSAGVADDSDHESVDRHATDDEDDEDINSEEDAEDEKDNEIDHGSESQCDSTEADSEEEPDHENDVNGADAEA